MRKIKTLVSGLILCVSAILSNSLLIHLGVSIASAQTQAQSRQLARQPEPVKSWPGKAKRWALVIGVDQYRDGQINALKGSVNDAHNLANALVRYAGFPQDQIIVLTTDQPDERQPSRINILTYLSNLASLVPKDGLLLISFAGHGIERSGQAYLIPSDARLSRDISLLEESAVSVTRMRDRIKAIGVGQVIVLLDACRNDPGGRADAPNNMSAAYAKFNFDVRNHEVQAFATIYATAIGQRAYEYTEKRQGYFTWAIVEGLKGGAANDKGEVTLAALVKYVQDNVPKRIAIDLGAGQQQKPFATIEGYRADELVVALSGLEIGKGGLSRINTPIAAQSVPVEPSASDGLNSNSLSGKYLSTKNSGSYIEFKSDGTFFLSQVFSGRVFQSVGKYELDSKQIILKLEMGQAARGIVEKDKISFEDGTVYMLGDGATASVPATKEEVIITSAFFAKSPAEKVVPSELHIGGTGWDGGSDLKVIVNGRDTSKYLDQQSAYGVSLKGTIRELNIRDGKNEVVVIVKGVSSRPYEFKQAIR